MPCVYFVIVVGMPYHKPHRYQGVVDYILLGMLCMLTVALAISARASMLVGYEFGIVFLLAMGALLMHTCDMDEMSGADGRFYLCAKDGKCTSTLKGVVTQPVWSCQTCGPRIGVCLACHLTCHKGHVFSPASGEDHIPFICDCTCSSVSHNT